MQGKTFQMHFCGLDPQLISNTPSNLQEELTNSLELNTGNELEFKFEPQKDQFST